MAQETCEKENDNSLDGRDRRKLANHTVAKVLQAWCPKCAWTVRMVPADEAATLVCLSARALRRYAEAGSIHSMEAPDGSLLVCLESLRRYRSVVD